MCKRWLLKNDVLCCAGLAGFQILRKVLGEKNMKKEVKKLGKKEDAGPEKRAYNVYMDKDLADYIQERYPGMGAKIITGLSKKFKEETQDNPGFVMDVIDGEFELVSTRRDKNRKGKS